MALTPAESAGVVYAGYHDGTMRAINASSGALIWSTQLSGGNESSTPLVASGMVYVISGLQFVTALDASSGAIVWQYNVGRSPPPNEVIGLTAFALGNGVIAIGGDVSHRDTDKVTGIVIALNTATGTQKWSFDPPSGDDAESITMADGLILASVYTSPNLYALKPASGDVAYKITLPGSDDYVQSLTPIVVADGVGYAETSVDSVLAFTVGTGAILWDVTPGTPGHQMTAGPAVSGGRVYVGDDYDPDLCALSASTGATVQTYPVPFFAAGELSVNSGQIFAASGSTLRTVSVFDGGVRWVYRSGSHKDMFAPPTVVAGVAYTPTNLGGLYAVKGPHSN